MHYSEGPKNILADNLSRLYHLVTPAQLAEGKNLVEPAVVSDDKDKDVAFFVDPLQSGVLDEDIINYAAAPSPLRINLGKTFACFLLLEGPAP